jgi:Flp pilus assembly pilin Flp
LIIYGNWIKISAILNCGSSGVLVMRFFTEFLHEQSGAGAAELGLIAAVLALAVASALGLDASASQVTAIKTPFPS